MAGVAPTSVSAPVVAFTVRPVAGATEKVPPVAPVTVGSAAAAPWQ